jgi:hypothetical protein
LLPLCDLTAIIIVGCRLFDRLRNFLTTHHKIEVICQRRCGFRDWLAMDVIVSTDIRSLEVTLAVALPQRAPDSSISDCKRGSQGASEWAASSIEREEVIADV